MRGQNVLIIGAGSYIGGCLTEYARARGAEVVALTSKDCNLLNRDEVDKFFGALDPRPYTVMFLAVVNKPVANSFESYADNVRMVRHVIEARQRERIESIIYFSSVDVYGRRPTLPISEESSIDPDTWYGLAKYCCEWMLHASGELRCPATILHIPGVYGSAPNDRSVIGHMVATIRSEKRVVIHGTGAALRDYVYLGDVCRLVEALVPLRYDGVLNVATGTSRPIVEFARAVGSALQTEFEVVYGPGDGTREFDLVFDVRRLTTVVPGFRFSDFMEGIRTYL